MARITKADIYRKHGIEFDGTYIMTPYGKTRELLKQGNTKVGKHVWTWSILPTNRIYHVKIGGVEYDVKGTCCCHCVGCYATKGNYNFKDTIRSLAINTLLVNNHIDFVKRAIAAQLEIIGSGEVRIHAAGDFFTESPDEYANMWREIVASFRGFIFWTYTKVVKFESLFDDFKNANIVKSIIANVGVNFGHCDYILSAYYTLREMGESVYICKCGIDDSQHCEGCAVCSTYKYVLFVEHSTEYVAAKDPAFAKLCEVVNHQ